MTKQLKDLFSSFSDMGAEDQLAKIREIRHSRAIERPAVAQKKQIKQEKVSRVTKGKVEKSMAKLSEEDRAAIIAKLKQEMGE